MIELVSAIAATILGAGLYMWLPDGHKKWGVFLTLSGIALFGYAIYLFYSIGISLELLQIGIYDSSQISGSPDIEQRGPGTYILAWARITNSDDEDSVLNLELIANGQTGQEYHSATVVFQGQFNVFPPTARPFQLVTTDELFYKAVGPLVRGDAITGWMVAFFAAIPKSDLELPGTVFTLSCKDVVHGRSISANFVWKGKGFGAPLNFFPGMKYLPVSPTPTSK